jgi:hypothetical protein
MEINELPACNTENETGCCPRFRPEPWENQDLHFDNKPFVKASTIGVFHVPLNMGSVFSRTLAAIKEAHAENGGPLVLSHDRSAWRADHLFAVAGPVPGAEIVHLSGDFLTRVFEGPYSNVKKWCADMERYVRGKGKQLDTTYFFYTTCPRCARHYGKNYVVGVAKVH